MNYEDFLRRLSKSARSALAHEGIDDFNKLASLSQKELLLMHGIGPKTLPVVHECLKHLGLRLKD